MIGIGIPISHRMIERMAVTPSAPARRNNRRTAKPFHYARLSDGTAVSPRGFNRDTSIWKGSLYG